MQEKCSRASHFTGDRESAQYEESTVDHFLASVPACHSRWVVSLFASSFLPQRLCFPDPPPPAAAAKVWVDPSLDGRKLIAMYNNFMDVIFRRMNLAIQSRNLDPMDLKILPTMIQEYKNKVPRADDDEDKDDFSTVSLTVWPFQPWMSKLFFNWGVIIIQLES